MSADIDVFISYSRADRETARQLADLLEQRGYAVWWDWNLIGGQDYRSAITEALQKAGKVIVLWSQNSIASGFVLDEAGHARDNGKLVPLVIDASSPPFGFGNLHTLTSHDLDRDIDAIVAAIENQSLPTMARRPDTPAPRASRRGLLLAGGAAALATAGIGGGAWWASREDPAPAPAGSGTNRIALVLGINTYANLPHLQNAGNDAVQVSDLLRARGFKVMEVHDADGAQIRDSIHKFKTLLALGGVGLFYFAGQAAHIDGKDYILPADAPAIQTEEELIAAAIEIGDVTGPIENFLAGTPSDPRVAGICIGTTAECAVADDAVLDDATPPTALPIAVRDNGVFLVYAAAEGELAMDGASHMSTNSPFAEALIAEIGTEEGELSDLARRIRARVKEVTGGAQNPVMEDQSDAPFFFNRPQSDPAEGVLRIVMLDSCRDNPFALAATR